MTIARRLQLGLLCVMPFAVASGATQTFGILHSFDGNAGAYPYAPLIEGSDGNLYGTAFGLGPEGVVYRMSPAGVYKQLYGFSGQADGGFPASPLVEGPDGNFYGTTSTGAASNAGTVFVMTPAGVLTTLHTFSLADGAQPDCLVLGHDGNFYGTTQAGGTNNLGVVFRITAAGDFTVLHEFARSEGAHPQGLVQGRDGIFYGATYRGGSTSNDGTIFLVTAAGRFATLHSFTGADGAHPTGVLVQDAEGNLYGTTDAGGPGGGTLYRFSPVTRALTTLYGFSVFGGTGSNPDSGVILGPGGVLLGTAAFGGASNEGVVFELTPDGTLTILHSFEGEESGQDPLTGVLRIGRRLYGTTNLGGEDFDGTVFVLTF